MSQVTNQKLWDSIKRKWHKGDKGGKAGQWNARKAQLAVKEYKKRGGTYKTKRKNPNNSLVKWTKEEWGYIDGKKGNRYLPVEVRKQLTEAEKRKENKLKKSATHKGKQKASWSKSVTKKVRVYGGKPAVKKGGRPKRLSNRVITFSDYPEFRPNLTPREIFKLGSFGGTYWRPIKSGVTKKNYKNKHREFPKNWWSGISDSHLTSSICDKSKNKYGVKSGTSLKAWESKKWIKAQDPYGWVQWYCRFYNGRRSVDDVRQIKRWLAFAGPKGRFKLRLVNMLKSKRKKWNDYSVSPVIRQGLQHWAYQIKSTDVK